MKQNTALTRMLCLARFFVLLAFVCLFIYGHGNLISGHQYEESQNTPGIHTFHCDAFTSAETAVARLVPKVKDKTNQAQSQTALLETRHMLLFMPVRDSNGNTLNTHFYMSLASPAFAPERGFS